MIVDNLVEKVDKRPLKKIEVVKYCLHMIGSAKLSVIWSTALLHITDSFRSWGVCSSVVA